MARAARPFELVGHGHAVIGLWAPSTAQWVRMSRVAKPRFFSAASSTPLSASDTPTVRLSRFGSAGLLGFGHMRIPVAPAARLVHFPIMPKLAASQQPPLDSAAVLDWYDRHARAAALARLAGRPGPRRRARPLSRLAQRDHAAADDGRDGRRVLRALPRALADGSAIWPRRRSKPCSSSGRGSAITPAPAISTPAPMAVVERFGGDFPHNFRRTADAAGRRPLHRRRHRRHRLRRADRGGRRQCRSRARALSGADGAGARRQGRDPRRRAGRGSERAPAISHRR